MGVQVVRVNLLTPKPNIRRVLWRFALVDACFQTVLVSVKPSRAHAGARVYRDAEKGRE